MKLLLALPLLALCACTQHGKDELSAAAGACVPHGGIVSIPAGVNDPYAFEAGCADGTYVSGDVTEALGGKPARPISLGM